MEKLKELTDVKTILFDEPMSLHTSFKVGGKASVCVYAENGEQLREIVRFALEEKIPYFCMGAGSNLLVSDEGYDGIVIIMKNNDVVLKPERRQDGRYGIRVPAGLSLMSFARQAARLGLEGIEFAAGIPGSVGGAVAMNAGAYGGEIKDIIFSADVLDENGEIKTLGRDELELEYRNSAVLKKGLIVVSAYFVLETGDSEKILEEIGNLNAKRREKQPLEYPSAGSTFKRPGGYFAGKLIQDAGLRGFMVGGAQVSEKHCGFVINKSNASAADIYRLVAEVSKRVYEQFGVNLEMEVKLLGDFSYAE